MRILFNNVRDTILDVKPDKRNECYNFGDDNAFPSLVEALVNTSPTSKTCVDRVSKAITGKYFGNRGKIIVNSKGQTLNEVFRVASREYAKHNNVYIHLTYNGELRYKAINVIPVTDIRIGKGDDYGYSSKLIEYSNWDKREGQRIMKDDFTLYDRFNSSEGVILRQIEAAGGIEKYNGQIIHIKKDSTYVYSLTDLYPVMPEALLESNAMTFRSRGAEKGFLNTKLLTVQPFASEEERRTFKKELKSVRGADNSSEVVILESSQPSDDLAKTINLSDLSSPYDDELFKYSEDRAEKNIAKAFSVPLVLVSQDNDGLFGNSGETLREARKQLFESREEDRDQIAGTIIELMENFKEPVIGLEVIDPYEELINSEEL